MWFIIMVLGGLIGVVGYSLYQAANTIISRGNSFWGFGWLFQNISSGEASLYQFVGLAGMVIGGILVLAGLVKAFKRS